MDDTKDGNQHVDSPETCGSWLVEPDAVRLSVGLREGYTLSTDLSYSMRYPNDYQYPL